MDKARYASVAATRASALDGDLRPPFEWLYSGLENDNATGTVRWSRHEYPTKGHAVRSGSRPRNQCAQDEWNLSRFGTSAFSAAQSSSIGDKADDLERRAARSSHAPAAGIRRRRVVASGIAPITL